MHKLVELRETLVTELEEYGGKEQLDMASLDVIDKLAHAIKNLDKVINSDCCDDYGSSNGGYDYYDRGTYSKRGRMSGLRQRDNGDYRRYSDEYRDSQQSRGELTRSQRYE